MLWNSRDTWHRCFLGKACYFSKTGALLHASGVSKGLHFPKRLSPDPLHTHLHRSEAQPEFIPFLAFCNANSSSTSPSPGPSPSPSSSPSSSSYSVLSCSEYLPCAALYYFLVPLCCLIPSVAIVLQLQRKKVRPRMPKWLLGSLS